MGSSRKRTIGGTTWGAVRLLAGLGTVAAKAFMFVRPSGNSLLSSGERRRYLLYVPESYDPSVPTPLVVSLHGFAEWPGHQRDISHWNDLADEEGFIVVYPSGTGAPLRWRTLGAQATQGGLARDVTFISDLIDALSAGYTIDPARIYVNGLSNGGGMAFALSCNLSERIAAFGSVSGAYAQPWDACRPSRQVPAIIFHGTADPLVPFDGGATRASGLPFPAVPQWVETLARRNACQAAPEELPAKGSVRGIRYRGCDADVVFYTIEGGGHAWPGGSWMPSFIVGHITHEIDATRVMWDFFRQHPLVGDEGVLDE